MARYWYIKPTKLGFHAELEKDCIYSACHEQSASSSFVRSHSLLPFSSTHTSSYNSVISPVNPAYAYNIYQVTEDWVDNGFRVPTSSLFKGSTEEPSSYEEPSPYYYPDPYYYPEPAPVPQCDTPAGWSDAHSWVPLDTDPFFLALAAVAKAGHWEKLTSTDCIKAYNTVLQTQYSNVFLVFNESKSVYGSISGATQWPTISSEESRSDSGVILTSETILPGLLGGSTISGLNQPESGYVSPWIDNTWICELAQNCNIASLISSTANWTFEYCPSDPMLPYGQIACENAYPGCWPRQAVEYCLAQPASATCSIQVSVDLMTVVVVFNSVKIICFVFTLWKGRFTPLVTLGDAMRSFLMVPDDTTAALAPVSAAQLRKHGSRLRQVYSCPRCIMLQMEKRSHMDSIRHEELFELNPTAGLLASSAGWKSRETRCHSTSEFFSTSEAHSFLVKSGKPRWFRGAGLWRWLWTYIV